MIGELSELDKQIYKEAQDDDDDDDDGDDGVISEEKTSAVKGLREAFSSINDAVDYFRDHDLLYDHSAKVRQDL
jgi:hypothetical protein